jgi:predicted nucleotidyltransferase
MSLAARLVELLREQAGSLTVRPALAEQAQVVSVALIGSLARDDFRAGGSDVDLMLVHTHGEKPAGQVAAVPAVRRLVQHFGEPLLKIGAGTGAQKPFMVDCHFVDSLVLATQPRWAEPSQFTLALAQRNTHLWLYAFDLVQHAVPLFGPSPALGLDVHPPAQYTGVLRQQLHRDLEALCEQPAEVRPETIESWKLLAGRMMVALALGHGGGSLNKSEVHRSFNILAPRFPGKDFAASLWAEYLYGSVFQDRAEWLQRCRRFCEGGLGVL